MYRYAVIFAFFAASLPDPVAVSVDWAAPTGAVASPEAYGLNVYGGFDPAHAGSGGNAAYRENMAAMSPGIVRYHRWDMIAESSKEASGWATQTDTAAPGWDGPKIRRAMTGAYPHRPRIMLNLPGWPPSMQVSPTDARLRPDLLDAYAAWCAELVRVVNIENRSGVRLWEVTNERDDVYDHDCAALGRIFLKCADAMRKVDPTIQVGGPAFARPDLAYRVEGFLGVAAQSLDFVSYHSYVSGSRNDPDAAIYDRAQGLGGLTRAMKATVARFAPRPIATYHDEYNISWSPPDDRMAGAPGAVFDALALMATVRATPSGTMAWNDADGWYGKLDGEGHRRPASYVFEAFNARLRGRLVGCVTSDAKKVDALAALGTKGPALALVNRSGTPIGVALSLGPAPRSGWRVERVGAAGRSAEALVGSTLVLAADSVAFVFQRDR